MNIQNVINRALSDNSDITVSEVRDTPEVVDAEITKLAAALNFIGTNLEHSVPTPNELLAQAEITQSVLGADQDQEKQAFILPAAVGAVSQSNQQKRMDAAGVPYETQRKLGPSMAGSIGRNIGYNALGGVGGLLAGGAVGALGGEKGMLAGGLLGSVGGGIYGMHHGTKKNEQIANEAIQAHQASGRKKRKKRKKRRGRSKYAGLQKEALIPQTLTGLVSHDNQQKRMDAAGVPREIQEKYGPSIGGSLGRQLLYSTAGGAVPYMLGAGDIGAVSGAALGMYGGTVANQALADDAIRRHQEASRGRKGRKKTASLNDPLYQAAQLGKESLLEKIAEDRINPAKISAGPADPYSGQIMPNPGAVSSEFVGSSRTPKALIDLKAQKVRDRINSDMKKYVKNVGDGYNMQGHLSKFNK